jgi:hypothetical protein
MTLWASIQKVFNTTKIIKFKIRPIFKVYFKCSYQSGAQGQMTDYNGTSWASDPDMYDLETHMLSGSSWGSYFWLGGPGAG